MENNLNIDATKIFSSLLSNDNGITFFCVGCVTFCVFYVFKNTKEFIKNGIEIAKDALEVERKNRETLENCKNQLTILNENMNKFLMMMAAGRRHD